MKDTDNMRNKKLLIQLKYGALLGVGFSIIQYLRGFSEELEHFVINPILDLAIILLFIGALYFAFKILRDELLDGVLRFKKAFLFGLGLIFMAFGFASFCLFITYTVIDKDALTKINDKYTNRYIEAIGNDTIKNEEIAHFLQKTQNVIDAQKSNDTIKSMLNNLMQDYETTLNNRPIEDTIHYKMKYFNQFADSLLTDLMKQRSIICADVLPENCIPEFENAAENVIHEMQTVNVVQIRYEAEKEKVLQHKYKTVTALYSAILVIVYGLFFNIFVSLYIFRNKKAKIVDEEDMAKMEGETDQNAEENVDDIEQDINTKE